MGAYIDRDELLKLYANTDDLDISNYDVKIAVIRQNILDMPTVDIVMCEECKYYKGHEEYCEIDHFARENGFCSSGKRRTDETIESITFKKMVKAVEEEMREVRNFVKRRNDEAVCSYGVSANANQHTQRIEGIGERRTNE